LSDELSELLSDDESELLFDEFELLFDESELLFDESELLYEIAEHGSLWAAEDDGTKMPRAAKKMLSDQAKVREL